LAVTLGNVFAEFEVDQSEIFSGLTRISIPVVLAFVGQYTRWHRLHFDFLIVF